MPFNGRFVLNSMHFASRHGADISSLIQLTGYSEKQLNDENCQLESEVYNRVVNSCVAQTGDEFFGLHLGESLNLSAAGLVAQITQTSQTVKQALEYACEFAQLACSSLPMKLEEKQDHYKLTMTPEPLWLSQSAEAVKQTIDGTLVFTIREFHELTRKQHYPLKIHLPFNKPSSMAEYERLLQCPIRFNQPETAFFFRKEDIEARIITSDYKLLRILVTHAEQRIASINQEKGFYELVKASVTALIKPEFPSIEQVASHFNISVRTLQRRLADEGHSFKEVIETLREEFAYAYLKKEELSVNQVAYLLNYTDASGFIRSFKRWTGQTPREWRTRQ